MNKILFLSKLLRACFLIALAAIPLGLIIYWWQFPQLSNIEILYPMNGATKLMGFFVSLVFASFAMATCFYMAKLFQQYAQLQFFSKENTQYLLRSGVCLLIFQFLRPFFEMIITLITTWQNPAGSRFISASFSHINLGLIVAAIVMVVIAMIMQEAYKLQQENKLTI